MAKVSSQLAALFNEVEAMSDDEIQKIVDSIPNANLTDIYKPGITMYDLAQTVYEVMDSRGKRRL
jgi:hypothetical protein